MKRVCALVLVALVAVCASGCKKGGDAHATAAAAKEMLGAFIKPGADPAALTAALRPKPGDYEAVFVGEAAQKVKGVIDPIWDSGKAVLKPSADQTEITVAGATPEQFAKGEGNAGFCPPAYKEIADKFTPKIVIWCAHFTKPGEKQGFNVDGLIYINDHWALFPRSYKALKPGGAPAGGAPAPAATP